MRERWQKTHGEHTVISILKGEEAVERGEKTEETGRQEKRGIMDTLVQVK